VDVNVNFSLDRLKSVSSIRRKNYPSCFFANSQLNNAVRVPPRWSSPVGLGANRTLMDEFCIENDEKITHSK